MKLFLLWNVSWSWVSVCKAIAGSFGCRDHCCVCCMVVLHAYLVQSVLISIPDSSQHRVQLQTYPPRPLPAFFYYSNTFCNSSLGTPHGSNDPCLGQIISVATHYNFQRTGRQMRYAYPYVQYIHIFISHDLNTPLFGAGLCINMH